MEGTFLRILHFGRFWSANMGGIERHVDLLLTELAGHGIECCNLVANDARHTEIGRHHGYSLVKAASWGVKFRTALSPQLARLALRLHHERPFDLVHAHFPDPLTHLVLALLPASLPKVITWHSDLVPYPALQKLYLPLVHRTLRSASAIVGATPAHLQTPQLLADIAPGKLHVIPYGMDFSPYMRSAAVLERALALKQIAGDRPLVFAVGRHVAYKGFEVLIQAMQQLPDAFLVLGGTGPLWQSHRNMAHSLGVADRIHFAGRIPDEDLPAWYHACDVFCMPSTGTTEAFGLVQLEAMACGKPVVCTRLGNGVNHVHQDGLTGLAVPPADAAALAGALESLLANPALARRMGSEGERRALGCYSLDAMTTPTLQLYRSLTD